MQLTWMTCEEIFPELKESEDEKIRKELIKRFNWELKGAEEQDAAGCSRQKDIAMFKRWISWLKSIKPKNWKPNDLQLEALESAYKQLPNIQYFLHSLYNDLKNL